MGKVDEIPEVSSYETFGEYLYLSVDGCKLQRAQVACIGGNHVYLFYRFK